MSNSYLFSTTEGNSLGMVGEEASKVFGGTSLGVEGYQLQNDLTSLMEFEE